MYQKGTLGKTRSVIKKISSSIQEGSSFRIPTLREGKFNAKKGCCLARQPISLNMISRNVRITTAHSPKGLQRDPCDL